MASVAAQILRLYVFVTCLFLWPACYEHGTHRVTDNGFLLVVFVCCGDILQIIETRLRSIQSAPVDAMDTSEEAGNRQLEAEYLTLLGTKLARCVMELLVIALMKLRSLKQERRGYQSKELIADFAKQLVEAAGQT